MKTGGGSIELGDLSAPTEVSTSAGSIQVRSARARLEAVTSGGSIEIDDAQNTVVARTAAGSVTADFSAQPEEDCRLTTSGGTIQVRIAENLAFDLEAKTGGGRVNTELPIVATVLGEHVTGELKGKLNGGGKLLFLKTGAGSISIRKH